MRSRKKPCRVKTRSLPCCRWCSEAPKDLRGCMTVAACSIPPGKTAGALRWFCFPALGKKVFVRNHASRATVEKCTPFLEKGDSVAMSKKLIRLLVGAALTVAVAYVLATHTDKVRPNVGHRHSIHTSPA